MQLRGIDGQPLSHGGNHGKRNHAFAKRFATAAEVSEAASHSMDFAELSGAILDNDIDGHLIDLIKPADLASVMPRGDPLALARFMRFLEAHKHPPLPPLPQATCLGDRLVLSWVENPSVDIRSRILIMAEAVMLLSGLLFTVSAEALLNAPCIDGSGCERTEEKVDLLLWTFAVGTELLSVGVSVATCNIVSTLSDEDLRVWIVNHWLKYQSAQLWMTLNTGWILPTSIAARLCMHAPSHLVYAAIGIFFVLLGVTFNGE